MQVGTELREDVVVAYAVGLASLTICPFGSLYPAEFCWICSLLMVIHLCLCRMSALDIACLANLMGTFPNSMWWRTQSVLLGTRPRDRDPVLFVWYTLLLSTTVLYESARFYAATARITLLSVVLVAICGLPDVSLSMFFTACKNDAYFSPRQLDEKVGRQSEVFLFPETRWNLHSVRTFSHPRSSRQKSCQG